MLPGWVWGFLLTTLKTLSYHGDNKLKKSKGKTVGSEVVRCASLRSQFWSFEIGGSGKSAVLWVWQQLSGSEKYPRNGLSGTVLYSARYCTVRTILLLSSCPPLFSLQITKGVWSQRLVVRCYSADKTLTKDKSKVLRLGLELMIKWPIHPVSRYPIGNLRCFLHQQ